MFFLFAKNVGWPGAKKGVEKNDCLLISLSRGKHIFNEPRQQQVASPQAFFSLSSALLHQNIKKEKGCALFIPSLPQPQISARHRQSFN